MDLAGLPIDMRKDAVVVGVNEYPSDSGLAKLRFAEADARELDRALRERCGFKTTLLLGPDASRDALERSLLSEVGRGDVFLFFFAGHGQQIRGQYHLHPANSKGGGLGSIPFDSVARVWQGEFGYEKVLAILDACRSEQGGARGGQAFGEAEARDIRAAIHGRRRVEVIYGCSDGQVSYEDESLGHGVFTHALLKALDEHAGNLDSDMLAGATADCMADWCREDPRRRWQVAHRYHVPSLKDRLRLAGAQKKTSTKFNTPDELRLPPEQTVVPPAGGLQLKLAAPAKAQPGQGPGAPVLVPGGGSKPKPADPSPEGCEPSMSELPRRPAAEEVGDAFPPSTRTVFPWHYIHPNFQRELLAPKAPVSSFRERLFGRAEPIPAPATRLAFYSATLQKQFGEDVVGDPKPYLDAGCVGDFGLFDGGLRFSVDVDALVMTGSHQLLLRWLDSAPVTDDARGRFVQLLKRYYAGRFAPNPDAEPDDAKAVLDPCLWGAILRWRFGRPDDARIPLLAKANGTQGAKAWMVLFGDETSAGKCFRQAESEAKNREDFRLLAIGGMEAFHDYELARRCLLKGEAAEGGTANWLNLAGTWRVLFNDSVAAKRCLEKAESQHNRSRDWVGCADHWQKFMRDSAAARRFLKKAESAAKKETDLAYKCFSEGSAVQDADGVKSTHHTLESEKSVIYILSGVPTNWIGCAGGWQAVFQDSSAAERCLGEAEAIADRLGSAFAWTRCADGWQTLLQDSARARRCLQEAELAAGGSLDWTHCAEGWQTLFQDSVEAKRYLQKAESAAGSSLDWTHCAEGWQAQFQDPTAAKRCLEKAESAAGSTQDWLECAHGWGHIFQDFSAAKRCLEKAELSAKELDERNSCDRHRLFLEILENHS